MLRLESVSSLVNTGNAGAAAPQAKWTVMVYMSGDNNLEDFISKDLETELARAGVQRERPGHRPGRPRPRLRQEPRGLADHQALPRDAGDDGAARAARSPTGASATWATRRPWSTS